MVLWFWNWVKRYLIGDGEQEQNRTHGSGNHAEQLWIQTVHVPKLPARLQTQLPQELDKSQANVLIHHKHNTQSMMYPL